MSYKASNAVAELSDAKANARLVAFVLAEAAHMEDASCYLGTETIADRTKCHRNTVTSAIKALAEAGELRVWQRLVKRPDGAVNLYQLVLPGLPHEQRPPQAGMSPPDLGPGFAQDQGQPVRPLQRKGSPNSAGGTHNQPVREPSTEPSTTVKRAERAREQAGELPPDFPPALTEHARQAHRVLASVAEQHNAREVTLRAVALTMQGQPRRRYVSEAHALAAWAQAPPRPIRDVVGTYRTWLSRADVCAGVEPLGAPATNGNVHAMRPRRNGQPTLSDFVALTEQLRAEELAT